MSLPLEGPLLIMYGTRAKRKILHRSIQRSGTWVPRCNIHYRSALDKGRTRTFRDAEGDELTYPVCGRCDKASAFQAQAS
jgi:hypothetical protein